MILREERGLYNVARIRKKTSARGKNINKRQIFGERGREAPSQKPQSL